MKTKLTRSNVEALNKEQLVELVMLLGSSCNEKLDALDGYKIQLKNISTYLNTHNIVVELQSGEATADAAKFIITKADEILAKVVSLESDIMPEAKDDSFFVEKARKGAVSNFIG